MAEAIGLASGIAGLLSLTIEVYATSSRYIAGVRGAKGAIRDILRELRELKIILTKLDTLFEYGGDDDLSKQKPLSITAFEDADEYHSILETLRKKLESEAGGNTFSAKLKSLKWPFSEERTRGTVDILHRHVQNFRAAMDVDTFGMVADTLRAVGRVERYTDDERTKTILKWLSSLDMNKAQADNIEKRHGNSGEWLTKHETFLSWVDQKSEGVLWCPGNPGAGKSILSSIIIDFLLRERSGQDCAVAYLYCDHKDPENQTATALLGAILKQLLAQKSRLPTAVVEFYEKLSSKHETPSFDQMRSLLLNVCASFIKIYVVVDALDECVPRASILPVLDELHRCSVQLLVTSRPHKPDIRDFFQPYPRLDIIAADSDIRNYVSEQVNHKFLYKETAAAIGDDLTERIISTITQNAQGLFLKAIWQSKIICKARNVKAIETALVSMPSETNEIYQDAVERIKRNSPEDRDYAFAILAWISYAKRPLLLEEVQHALAIQFSTPKHCRPRKLDEDDLLAASFMVDVCESLVTVENESHIIRLSHFTVQEYLETVRESLFLEAELQIARTCLTYLMLDAFSEGPCTDEKALQQRLAEFVFLKYAARNWGEHVRGHREILLSTMIIEFIEDNPKVCNAVQALDTAEPEFFRWCNRFGERPDNLRPLQNAASLGLDSIILMLIDEGADIHLTDGTFKSAAHWAAWSGHESTLEIFLDLGFSLYQVSDKFTLMEVACDQGREGVVALLLDRGFRVNTRGFAGHTALCTSCQMGRVTILRRLLSLGADPSIPTMFNESPLACAAWSGHGEVVKLLLDLNMDVHSKSMNGATPLHGAARLGQLDTVKILVEHGADVNSGAISGETPLHVAAIGGHDKVIEYLLDHGADINQKCCDDDLHNCEKINEEIGSCPERIFCLGRCVPGSTPLFEAARFGHHTTVKLLLGRGADANARSTKGKTVLSVAALNGRVPVMDILVGAGANIHDNMAVGGQTALHWAAMMGHSDAVKWLLDQGADIESRDGLQKTPLCVGVGEGKENVVMLMHENGADMTVSLSHGLTLLVIAAANGRLKVTELLIDLGASVNATMDNGQTALHWTVFKDQPGTARILLGKGADVNAADSEGWTPLLEAIRSDKEDMTKLLLKSGASPERLGPNGNALHEATLIGSLSMVGMLIEAGALVNAKDNSECQCTPLLIAAEKGFTSVVVALMDAGADTEAVNTAGETAFELAILNGHASTVKSLQSRRSNRSEGFVAENSNSSESSDIHAIEEYRDDQRILPGRSSSATTHFQHLRSRSDFAEGAGLLSTDDLPSLAAYRELSRSPMPPVQPYATEESQEDDDIYEVSPRIPQWQRRSISRSPSRSSSPPINLDLLEAVKTNKQDLVRDLLRQNAVAVNRGRDQHGRLPLHWAALNGNASIARILLDHGANYLLDDDRGWPPIHCAARAGSLAVLKLLLERGADPNTSDSHHSTPLTLAAEYGFTECVKVLLATENINVDDYDDDGDSALLLAAWRGHKDIVELLLKDEDINIEWKNDRGDTPLGLAFRGDHMEIHQMLREKISMRSRKILQSKKDQVSPQYPGDDTPEVVFEFSPNAFPNATADGQRTNRYERPDADLPHLQERLEDSDSEEEKGQLFYAPFPNVGRGNYQAVLFPRQPSPSPMVSDLSPPRQRTPRPQGPAQHPRTPQHTSQSTEQKRIVLPARSSHPRSPSEARAPSPSLFSFIPEPSREQHPQTSQRSPPQGYYLNPAIARQQSARSLIPTGPIVLPKPSAYQYPSGPRLGLSPRPPAGPPRLEISSPTTTRTPTRQGQPPENRQLQNLESLLKGMWKGTYTYKDGIADGETEFTLNTELKSNIVFISGQGSDEVGGYTIQGNVTEKGAITFEKAYARHKLRYSGVVAQWQRNMSGQWKQNDSWYGTFVFKRV